MIQTLTGFPTDVLAFTGSDHITKSDYETVLIPAVDEALRQPGKVRLYYQIGPGFNGIDVGAMWDDFRVGMEHLGRWERIAVVTDVKWIRCAIRAFGFLMPGVARIFRLEETAKAREWISEGLTR